MPANVRELNAEHVRVLAGSVRLPEMLVPVVVRAAGEQAFELAPGFNRVAAEHALGLAEVPIVLRDADTEDADRAVENITRKQLNTRRARARAFRARR